MDKGGCTLGASSLPWVQFECAWNFKTRKGCQITGDQLNWFQNKDDLLIYIFALFPSSSIYNFKFYFFPPQSEHFSREQFNSVRLL